MKTMVKATLLLGALFPSVVSAQEYPTKLVTIVVPFPAGASNDAIGRYLADSLSKLWKRTFVVENRPGGGSAIGSAQVAKSRPDGYTLLLVSSSFTTNAAVHKDLRFDPVKDLQPVSMVARGDVAVVTGSRLPMATLADLVREAKAQTIFYGTAGVGSTQHFNAELLSDALGIKMMAVPYPGGTGGLIDLAGGRIDVVVGTLGGLLSSISAGTAKPVAVLSKTRSKALPSVPTTADAGYPAAITENYWAIFVPTGTPPAVIARINEGVKTVTHSPEGRKFLANLDGEPTDLSVDEVTTYLRDEVESWTKLAKRLNISAN
jgi:tripartite-type tricarboxylate transporter receptor subunit TctC